MSGMNIFLGYQSLSSLAWYFSTVKVSSTLVLGDRWCVVFYCNIQYNDELLVLERLGRSN